uniref:Serine proteinase stubble n=1 Tax=Cacopsylla melanoneura TaxID=428564 RepID=A0A8D9FBQ3_9HEMI
MRRYQQSTESGNRFQLFSSSNANAYTSWTKPPSSTSSSHVQTSASGSSFTLRPSIYYTSKPTSSGSSHYLDSWSSDSNNEVESHMETTWSQKPSWHATSPLPFVTRPRPSSNLKPNKPHKKPWYTSTSTTTTTTTTTTSTTTPPPPSPSPADLVTMVTASLPLHMGSPSMPTTTNKPNMTLSASNKRDIPCGKAPLVQRHEVRIVGGQNAQFGEWPWQVSVRRTSFFGFSSTHRCGGALLNENWIATAGHCVDDLLTSQIKIRVGEYDFSKLEEPFPYQERGVVKKMVHPKYNFFTYEYDLAMVKLETPVEFAPNIVPICLPGSDDLLIGENATVTGWGRLSEGGQLPPVLQKVTVPIVSNEKCRSMFLRAGRYEFISDIFMCAGFDNGGRDSCQGDSGGPLQVRGKDGRYFLAGIISWGIGCAEANLPGVCTRISKFVPWILDTVT